jgi:hypothetical protein
MKMEFEHIKSHFQTSKDFAFYSISIFWVALEGGVGWFCWWLQDFLEKHNFPFWSQISSVLTGSLLLLAVFHCVFRFCQRKWLWWIYGALVLIIVAISFFSSENSTQSTPHLIAGIKGKHESIIWLTNDSLVVNKAFQSSEPANKKARPIDLAFV